MNYQAEAAPFIPLRISSKHPGKANLGNRKPRDAVHHGYPAEMKLVQKKGGQEIETKILMTRLQPLDLPMPEVLFFNKYPILLTRLE